MHPRVYDGQSVLGRSLPQRPGVVRVERWAYPMTSPWNATRYQSRWSESAKTVSPGVSTASRSARRLRDRRTLVQVLATSIPPAGVASTLAVSSRAVAPRAYATSDESAAAESAAAVVESGDRLSPPRSTARITAA